MFWWYLWLLAAGLIGLLWIVRFVAVEVAMRYRHVLCDASAGGCPHPTPKISIVLAAKDEEDNIEACVCSLLDQDYPDFELIVANDRSTDRTGEILDRLANQHGEKIRVVHVTSLPAGWFGKHNAIRMGMESARGDWLLFTDADCRQTSRRTLSLAMSEVHHHRVDFLSVLPNLERRELWEYMLQPVCAVILIVWFRPDKVNDPASPVAYANGAFMLMNRQCYETIGGHDAVRDRINEDIPMARRAKERGQRLRVVENRGLYVARMYDSPSAAFRGWSRIFYGCLEKPWRIGVALTLVFMAGVLPWLSFLASVAGGIATGNAQWWQASMIWALVVILLQTVTGRLYAAVGYGFGWSFTYALGAAVSAAILFNALLKALGLTGTTWRRTTYAARIQVW